MKFINKFYLLWMIVSLAVFLPVVWWYWGLKWAFGIFAIVLILDYLKEHWAEASNFLEKEFPGLHRSRV